MTVDYSLNYYQAEHNMRVLYHSHNLQVDQNGKLSVIAWYNIPKRIFIWISDFLDGGARAYKVNQTVLETFRAINQNGKTRRPRWTFSYCWIKSFDIGFDKVAVQVLADDKTFGRRFDRSIGDPFLGSKLLQEAYQTVFWVKAIRDIWNTEYQFDHLPDEEFSRITKEDLGYIQRAYSAG